MDWKVLIENLPYILAGIGFILWAAAQFVGKKAKADPAKNAWDKYAPMIKWASDNYSEALDWLCDTGVLKLKGQDKLERLNKLVEDFTKQFEAGNYIQAINAVVGFWRDARNKKLKSISANPSTVPESLKDSPAVEIKD